MKDFSSSEFNADDVRQELLERRAASKSFHEFVKQAWPWVEGGKVFQDGWHIEAICEHLEAVKRGEIKRLLINIPPRCCKPIWEEELVVTKRGRLPLRSVVIGDDVMTHRGRFKKVLAVYEQGEIETLRVSTADGRSVIAAPDHPFLTPDGWVNAVDLQVNSVLGVIQPKVRRDSFVDSLIYPDVVVSVEPEGLLPCRCLSVEEDETFTVNDIVVHNSTLISVMLPAWWWIDVPEEQFLYVSYAMNLSMRDSVKCRRVMESPWYKARWGNQFQLQGDQSTKIRFDNTKLGYRIATSVDGTLTGEGGSVLVCDDPNSARDTSEAMLESTVDWFTQVFSSRLNDPKTGKIIVIQQRIHENDVSGHILANDKRGRWTHLMLPLEFEEKRRCSTVILPSTGGEVWSDPRLKEGDSLWPERIGREEIDDLKNDLKSGYAIAGQLQQRPAPLEGGIIKKAWFQLWPHHRPFPEFEYVIQSYDTAFTKNTENDPTACTVWGIFKDNEGRWAALLCDAWSEHLSYPELKVRAAEDYDNKYGDPAHEVDLLLLEEKGSGIALKQDLIQAGLPVRGYNPGKADKMQRVHMVSYLIENGMVFLPESKQENRRGLVRDWVEPFLAEITMFPNAKHDDYVDTLTQALALLKDMGFLTGEQAEKTHDVDSKDESWDEYEEKTQNPYAL